MRLLQLLVVERRGDPARRRRAAASALGGDVLDVARAGVDRLDELGHDVDDQHALPGVGEGQGERQADVAGADDGNVLGVVRLTASKRTERLRSRPLAWPSP